MTEVNWEKPKHFAKPKRSERLKFISAGVIILVALLYLLVSGTLQGARYFITVDEVVRDAANLGRTVRISGAVDGETIEYDSENAIIRFEIVNIPSEYDDLATALHEALLDPAASRLRISGGRCSDSGLVAARGAGDPDGRIGSRWHLPR